VGVLGRYVGQRYDQDFSDFADASDIRYPDMLTLDLTAGLRLSRGVRFDLLVNNLTDENFYEKRGFNLMGRAVQLRVTSLF
jgi:outer membrane cobalamin receptor